MEDEKIENEQMDELKFKGKNDQRSEYFISQLKGKRPDHNSE